VPLPCRAVPLPYRAGPSRPCRQVPSVRAPPLPCRAPPVRAVPLPSRPCRGWPCVPLPSVPCPCHRGLVPSVRPSVPRPSVPCSLLLWRAPAVGRCPCPVLPRGMASRAPLPCPVPSVPWPAVARALLSPAPCPVARRWLAVAGCRALLWPAVPRAPGWPWRWPWRDDLAAVPRAAPCPVATAGRGRGDLRPGSDSESAKRNFALILSLSYVVIIVMKQW
jgi:hypothetical protein